jgi:hypothetical protein
MQSEVQRLGSEIQGFSVADGGANGATGQMPRFQKLRFPLDGEFFRISTPAEYARDYVSPGSLPQSFHVDDGTQSVAAAVVAEN